MNLSRRAMIAGGAVVAGAATTAAVLLWPRDEPDDDDGPNGAQRVADDLPDGVKLDDKGFAFHASRDTDAEPVWGAGVILSNAGGADRWVTVAYIPLDDAGAAVADEINPGGMLPLPADGELRVGIMETVQANVRDSTSGLAIRVYSQQSADAETSIIDTKVRGLSRDDSFDNVEFTALNEGDEIEAPDYALLYYDARGDIVGGWHTNRLAWDSFEEALPEGETDTYPAGESDHAVPVWLPPDIDADNVAMSLWAAP